MRNQILKYRLITVALLLLVSHLLSETALDYLALGIIIAGGIPHGANDWVISGSAKNQEGLAGKWKFILKYVMIGAAFLLIWLIFPLKALIVFLFLSVYHFGQAEVTGLGRQNRHARLYYFIWGGFALFFPLILHWPETVLYLEELTNITFLIPENRTINMCLALLGAAPLGTLIYLRLKKSIDWPVFLQEALHIGLLVIVYSFTPLLLGFAIYFVIWHSIDSVAHQISFIKSKRKYHIRQWILDALPMTFLSITGFMMIYFIFGPESIIAYGAYSFMFISSIALPHILIMDHVYEDEKEVHPM